MHSANRPHHPLPLLLLLAACALIIVGLPARSTAAQIGAPTPTPITRADERPDACEPNNAARAACALPMDTVSGPFTFLPEGDQDYYSLFLGAQPDGLTPTLTVRGTPGLELLTSITQADTGTPLATIASPAISTTLAADLTGWVMLRVENRGPGLATGQSYRIEVRKALPPPVSPTADTGPDGLTRQPATPDDLENNYSPETAAPIGVGVVYELSLVCPVTGGCAGGDHDYLRFAVKAGVRYLISTFDLTSGVDTVLDLLWYDPAQGGWVTLATNDDARPGAAFLSTLRWQAPADGTAIVRIAPRTGGLDPILAESDASPTYRVAVALAASELGRQIEERVALQTGQPAPSATPAPAAAAPADTSAADNPGPGVPLAPTPMPVTTSAPAGGSAYLIAQATVYVAPDAASTVLAELPADSLVTLTGAVSGLYAEVTCRTFVGAGWVSRRALRPAQASVSPNLGDGGTPVAGATGGAGTTGGATSTGPALRVRPLDPLPLPTVPAADPPVSLDLTVTVIDANAQPVSGVRLALTNAFGDRLVENLTGPAGSARLTAVVPVAEAVLLLAPDLGLQQRVGGTQTSLTMTVPEVAR